MRFLVQSGDTTEVWGMDQLRKGVDPSHGCCGKIFLMSRRFFGVPSFFNYAIADGICNFLFPDKSALRHSRGYTQSRCIWMSGSNKIQLAVKTEHQL